MQSQNITKILIVKLLLSSLQIHQPIGKGTLALILKGSKDKSILQRALDRSDFYGALFWYTIEIIEDFFLQLIDQQYIKVIYEGKYHLPYLELTEKGLRVLAEGSLVHIEERKKKVQVKMNESLEQTFQSFKELKSVPLIAQKRGLVESTIWKHLISLISLRYFSIDEILSKEKQDQIAVAIQKAEDLRLKNIKEHIPEISYEEIRCMLASLKIEEIKKAI